jgi:hypothetical protein
MAVLGFLPRSNLQEIDQKSVELAAARGFFAS